MSGPWAVDSETWAAVAGPSPTDGAPWFVLRHSPPSEPPPGSPAPATDDALYYAPGRLAAVPAARRDAFQRALLRPDHPPAEPEADRLRDRAAAAAADWADRADRPFAPVCLTVYPHNDCQLACAYCFSRPARRAWPRVSLAAVRLAATRVAANCRAAARPMTYVCHGGGEPMLDRPLVAAALAVVEEVAAAHGLALFRYVATNGVLSPAAAHWLAAHFDLVGLSCDGPPAVHDRQRPTARGGAPSSPFVARTAALLRDAGRPFHVRVTVTPDSCADLPRVADYVSHTLRPAEIHVEPAYGPGSGWDERPDAVDAFAAAFHAGRSAAAGIPWRTSLVRPGELHAGYCDTLRDVLHLLPDDSLSGCFLAANAIEAGQHGLALGTAAAPVERPPAPAAPRPAACAACLNAYHCTGGCPDVCLPADAAADPIGGFRCRLSRRLMADRLADAARALLAGDAFRAGRAAGAAIEEV